MQNSGEWGSLPLAGGIEVGHSYELKQLEKNEGLEARKARYRELDEEYRFVTLVKLPLEMADLYPGAS